jgi:hypothetical protein
VGFVEEIETKEKNFFASKNLKHSLKFRLFLIQNRKRYNFERCLDINEERLF